MPPCFVLICFCFSKQNVFRTQTKKRQAFLRVHMQKFTQIPQYAQNEFMECRLCKKIVCCKICTAPVDQADTFHKCYGGYDDDDLDPCAHVHHGYCEDCHADFLICEDCAPKNARWIISMLLCIRDRPVEDIERAICPRPLLQFPEGCEGIRLQADKYWSLFTKLAHKSPEAVRAVLELLNPDGSNCHLYCSHLGIVTQTERRLSRILLSQLGAYMRFGGSLRAAFIYIVLKN